MFQDTNTQPNTETLAAFERKFDEKLVEVSMTCECGETLTFALPTLAEVMLQFATHTC